MTRVTNVDQVLLLLRQQLQRMEKPRRSRKSGKTSATQRRALAPARLEAIARSDNLTQDELARTLIEAMLVDEFGEAVANDPKFRQMAGEVHRIIADEPAARGVLEDAVRKVRKITGGGS